MSPFTPKVESLLESYKIQDLRQAYEELSNSYRKKEHSKRFMTSTLHRISYMAVRMPATFAVCQRIVEKLTTAEKEISTFLDLGAGFGALSWAMDEAYPYVSKTLIEQDSETITLGEKLELPNSNWRVGDFRQSTDNTTYDAIGFSYALSEVAPSERASILAKAWHKTNNALILIEPGTPEGFDVIAQARAQLIEAGASIVAPCTHKMSCPMTNNESWCHFSQYVPRSKSHMDIKKSTLPYEHEKFSYVIFSKEPIEDSQRTGCIVSMPLKRRGHVLIDQCRAGKIERVTIAQRDKKSFKHAKKSSWGDSWENAKIDP